MPQDQSTSTSKTGCFVALFIWLLLGLLAAVAWRFVVQPMLDQELTEETSAAANYDHEIDLALDSFSGYAILRSPVFAKELGEAGIRLRLQDDQADYASRLRALKKGSVDAAVFTIDALLTAGAEAGDFPASIVLVLDETVGADAIVGHESSVPDLGALNHPEARIHATPNSPSEFLARVVVSHFHLPDLPKQWLAEANGAEEVFERAQKKQATDSNAPSAYVVWEPYVSKAKQIPGMQVLVDSSRLKGYIIDVLVVSRAFLRDQPELAKHLVTSYLRATYHYQSQREGMQRLLTEDARRSGAPLEASEVKALQDGIAWANTLDNYHYMDLLSQKNDAIKPIAESITAITDVLVNTGRLAKDPLDGRPETLYFDRILKELQSAHFHPAQRASGSSPLNSSGLIKEEAGRAITVLADLTTAQWENLRPVGRLKAQPVSFSRGGSKLTIQGKRDLAQLAKKLKDWPQLYCLVRGQTRADGDSDANLHLAARRAEAVRAFLIEQGLPAHRIRAQATAAGGGQQVTFLLGEPPY
jgi:outer membrane protein OmpA-like peptidoglycan-associated protein/ABC-type nitrate/sulfonate/bicarbonate transport system substrate-binding protein